MDMATLKTLVIELKDSGMSFQDVADYLEKNYGITRTRQSLNGLYNRAKESIGEQEERQRLVCDIVNLYSVCDNATMVTRNAEEMGIDITYRQVLGILGDEKQYIESVRSTTIARIVSQIDNIDDIRNIKKTLGYKGVEVTDKRFNEYFEEAYKIYIKQKIEGQLSKIYRLTSDKAMAKRIGKHFNLTITTEDLKSNDI